MKKTAPIVRSEDIQYYIKDLKKIPVITHERELEIFRAFKNDKQLTKAARDRMVEELIRGNLRFVISVAKQYQNQGLDIADIISEGNIGLMKSIERFDVDSGFKFISYAVWWIKQQILYALNEYSRTIRIPSNVIQEAQKAKKEQGLTQDSFQTERSDISSITIPTTIDLFKEINEDGFMLIDILVNPNADSPEKMANSDEDLKHRIKYMMSFLDERESAIIDGYFGLTGIEKNLDDLGEEFGCTKERIRQLKDKAIKKLRNESFSLLKYL
jgi:RNA polymerase primary sigma factor